MSKCNDARGCASDKAADGGVERCACAAPAAKPAPVWVVTSQGKVSAAALAGPIVRLSPPDGVDDVLRAGGVDPATLGALPGVAVALDDARYTALAEAILGRMAYDATEGVWRHVLEAPATTVIGAGQAPRPTYEALRAAHLDQVRWLLMGGACAGVAR